MNTANTQQGQVEFKNIVINTDKNNEILSITIPGNVGIRDIAYFHVNIGIKELEENDVRKLQDVVKEPDYLTGEVSIKITDSIYKKIEDSMKKAIQNKQKEVFDECKYHSFYGPWASDGTEFDSRSAKYYLGNLKSVTSCYYIQSECVLQNTYPKDKEHIDLKEELLSFGHVLSNKLNKLDKKNKPFKPLINELVKTIMDTNITKESNLQELSNKISEAKEVLLKKGFFHENSRSSVNNAFKSVERAFGEFPFLQVSQTAINCDNKLFLRKNYANKPLNESLLGKKNERGSQRGL